MQYYSELFIMRDRVTHVDFQCSYIVYYYFLFFFSFQEIPNSAK